jgi:DUF1680 family protein
VNATIRKLSFPVAILIPVFAAAAPPQQPQQHSEAILRAIDRPAVNGANSYYVGNRPPLAPNPLIKLPLGSVHPEGWLRHQLVLEMNGFSGKLEELSQFCKFEGNEWTSPPGQGKFGWEEVPYWLRGYLELGYVLGDERIIRRANQWLNGVIATQEPNGYFGSQSNVQSERVRGVRSRMLDLWPNMVMLFPLRSLYEATGDKRVLPFMTKYFRWQMTVPLDDFLSASWQKQRAGDNLDSIYWLYNRTGDHWLLDLARVNHERTDDWSGGIASWHNVNFAECFREPAQFFQQAKDLRYLDATARNYDMMHRLYGQVPGGGYAADENARPGFNGPRNGTETCAWAEMMFSYEMLEGITGDRVWADRAEEVAFNSFPASMTPDLKGLHYITSPNQVQLDAGNKAPDIQNSGEMFSYNPYGYRCCQHNAAFGWPYFSEYLWMATRDNGVAAVLYAPSTVKVKVGDGTEVTLVENTSYPFEESITFTVHSPKAVRFPLVLRVPAWCRNPSFRLNGRQVAQPRSTGQWLVLDRTWSANDKIVLTLPANITVQVWRENRGAVSVNRGPLTYSLKIGERWARHGGSDEFPAQEVYATTPWNYGLVLNTGNPEQSFEVVRSGQSAAQPFTPEDAPVMLRAKGRRIPAWKLESNGMVGEIQAGPVKSEEPLETITLIPMGAARLRISSFPLVGSGPDAHSWDGAAPIVLASSSSHYQPPSAVFDGIVPSGSGDRSVPRFVWPQAGPQNPMWIEFRYPEARSFSGSEVYWAADGDPQGCQLPASWSLEWWDGSAWHAVEGVAIYPTQTDRFNQVRFNPVRATAIRLRAAAEGRRPAGILQWHVMP